MTIEQLLQALLGQLGLLVALLFILWSGWRGMWVFGWYAKEQRDRIQNLERRLDRAVGAAENGTGLAQRAASLAERQAGPSGE